MKRYLREILLLLWKVAKLYLWKLLRPRLRSLFFLGVLLLGLFGTLFLLVLSRC